MQALCFDQYVPIFVFHWGTNDHTGNRLGELDLGNGTEKQLGYFDIPSLSTVSTFKLNKKP